MRNTFLVLAMSVTSLSFAGTLSTTTPNNGSGGIFMNLTAGALAVDVTSFDSYFAGTAGGAANVEVWTRPGTYVGFDASNVGWTLTQTVAATSAGSTGLAPITLTSLINVGAGQTVAVYLHGVTTGQGLRYTGTSTNPPQTLWNNADLTLLSDVSRTGAVAFGGSKFTPRCFAGNVNYNVVPEPSTMAVLGIAGAALLRRRRK